MHDWYAQRQFADDVITVIEILIGLTILYICFRDRRPVPTETDRPTRNQPVVTKRAEFPPLESSETE